MLLGWFLGREQAGKVLLLALVNKVSNIVLDYLYIVVWGQKSAGAGTATAISQYLTLLLGLILIFQTISSSSLKSNFPKIIDLAAIKATFFLNRDILIRTLALVSTFAVFTNLSAAMGTQILAANTLLLQVVTLAAYFIDGIAFATESIAGNLQGKGSKQGLLPLLKLAGSSSLLAGLGFAIAFCLFTQPLFGLLTNHSAIITQVTNYVWWLFPVICLGSIAYVLDGYFLGLTAGKILRQSSLLASVLGFAPMAIAAWSWRSPHLLWLALALFMAARGLTLGSKVKSSL